MALGKKTGGRRKGVPNRGTRAARQVMAKKVEQLAEVIPEMFDGDAHALLMSIYKDRSQPMLMRMDAAAKAIRYEIPALQATAVTGKVTINMVNEILSELDGRSRGIPAPEDAAGRPRMAS